MSYMDQTQVLEPPLFPSGSNGSLERSRSVLHPLLGKGTRRCLRIDSMASMSLTEAYERRTKEPEKDREGRYEKKGYRALMEIFVSGERGTVGNL